jgi:hypothetical protein
VTTWSFRGASLALEPWSLHPSHIWAAETVTIWPGATLVGETMVCGAAHAPSLEEAGACEHPARDRNTGRAAAPRASGFRNISHSFVRSRRALPGEAVVVMTSWTVWVCTRFPWARRNLVQKPISTECSGQ